MNVDVTTRGPVAPEMSARAIEKIGELESAVGRPIIAARVVLHQEQNPSIPRPARSAP
jgi:hypothetical protein